MTTGYCVKCRKKVDLDEEEEFKMSNGKDAIKGKCSECDTTVFRIKPMKREGFW